MVGEGSRRCALRALRRSLAGETGSRLANLSAMMDLGHALTSFPSKMKPNLPLSAAFSQPMGLPDMHQRSDLR